MTEIKQSMTTVELATHFYLKGLPLQDNELGQLDQPWFQQELYAFGVTAVNLELSSLILFAKIWKYTRENTHEKSENHIQKLFGQTWADELSLMANLTMELYLIDSICESVRMDDKVRFAGVVVQPGVLQFHAEVVVACSQSVFLLGYFLRLGHLITSFINRPFQNQAQEPTPRACHKLIYGFNYTAVNQLQ